MDELKDKEQRRTEKNLQQNDKNDARNDQNPVGSDSFNRLGKVGFGTFPRAKRSVVP